MKTTHGQITYCTNIHSGENWADHFEQIRKNFPAINNFLFDYLPLYNKFRTPEMAMVIPQFLLPMLGVMAVQKIVEGILT